MRFIIAVALIALCTGTSHAQTAEETVSYLFYGHDANAEFPKRLSDGRECSYEKEDGYILKQECKSETYAQTNILYIKQLSDCVFDIKDGRIFKKLDLGQTAFEISNYQLDLSQSDFSQISFNGRAYTSPQYRARNFSVERKPYTSEAKTTPPRAEDTAVAVFDLTDKLTEVRLRKAAQYFTSKYCSGRGF